MERSARWARTGEIAAGIAIAAPLLGWLALLAVSAVERALGTGAPALLGFFGLGAIGLAAWLVGGAAVIGSRAASTDRRWPARAAILTAVAPTTWALCWAGAAAWASGAALDGPWNFLGAVH